MSERNVTIETITAIEKALAGECKGYSMENPTHRARLAWWIYNNFVDGDFAIGVERREKRINLEEDKQ